jgi:hypothetical protein
MNRVSKKSFKKSLIIQEETVYLIIFLISLVFILILFKNLIIDKIVVKNKENLCKMGLELKNSDNFLKNIFGTFGLKSGVCDNINTIKITSSEKEEILYQLYLGLKSSCSVIRVSDTFLQTDNEICPVILEYDSNKEATLSINDVLKLLDAQDPFINETLYSYCFNPSLNIETSQKNSVIELKKGSKIKICIKSPDRPILNVLVS